MKQATTKRKRELHIRLDITARRWLERNQMPNGTHLVLERKKNKRRVRGDIILHRHKLPPAADDHTRVSEALQILEGTFITDIEARGLKLKLYAPDGRDACKMLMSTVREIPGIPTEDDKERAENEEAEISLMAVCLEDDLDLAEEFSSSRNVVLRGYIRALRQKFTAKEINEAMHSEAA